MRTRRMAGSCAGGWGADSFGRKIRSGTIYRADLVSFVGVAVFWGFWKKGTIYHARTNVESSDGRAIISHSCRSLQFVAARYIVPIP